ncbi:uncharacterized protein LOC107458084 isoform X1 [Arachis duranensis]|uniref:Uncharacterized protein LOC107458084 isoform X1 n=1 Tax=Arachis duranensis TaxID=130453 RepID=A0A9C6WAR6_ARADU|nr:uncharacterized protein LOC107458084 isoform X1 [Arachis duranensis]
MIHFGFDFSVFTLSPLSLFKTVISVPHYSTMCRLVNERDREIEKQSWTLIGSWEELLWKVAELQEGWDALLEPTYNFTHQGRRRQSHRIHRVMYLTLMDHRVVECSIGLCCLYKEGHEDMM